MIAFLAMPIVSRLFSPADFSVLALYLAITSLAIVVACLQFDVAIPVAKSHSMAKALATAAALSSTAVVVFLAIPTVLIPDQIADILNNSPIRNYLWLVPIGVAAASGYSILQYWAVRMRQFGVIARSRIWQSALGVLMMIGLGVGGHAPVGLLLGNTINLGGGVVSLALSARKTGLFLSRGSRLRAAIKAAKVNFRYPAFSTPEAFINTASAQGPIILLAASSPHDAGFFYLSMQAMSLPIALIGASVSQVYISRLSSTRGADVSALTNRTIWSLLALAGPVLFAGGLLAPVVFRYVFGAEWMRSGEIVALMVPWTVAQFVTSPVSGIVYARRKQALSLFLSIFGIVGKIGGIALLMYFDVDLIVEFICLSSFIYYCVCLLAFGRISGLTLKVCFAPVLMMVCLSVPYLALFLKFYGGY